MLVTARLRLRPWRPDEAPRLLDILSRLEVVRWLGDQGPILMETLGEAQDRVERYAAFTAARAPLGVWAVEVADTGVVAGTVLLAELPHGDGEVEVAWFLHPDSWGHGYATEAAAALLDHAFAAGLPEIWALTHPGNDASQGVCRKLGMRHLGVATRWYAIPFEQYVVAADDWAARQPS
ncbi:MAG: GNAT family N-acetyltransferase [Nocardioidaceae bacterium]